MSGMDYQNNGRQRRNQQDWQGGLEKARSRLGLSSNSDVEVEDSAGGTARSKRASKSESVAHEEPVVHTRYRKPASSGEEPHQQPGVVDVSSEGTGYNETGSGGEIMGGEEVIDVAEEVRQAPNAARASNRRFNGQERELTPEEQAELQRQQALNAKFNKAALVVIGGVVLTGFVAAGYATVRSLWGKKNSSFLMNL